MINSYQSSLPTLFLSECVLVYIQPDAVNPTLQYLEETFTNNVIVVYEQIRPNDPFGSMMIRNLHVLIIIEDIMKIEKFGKGLIENLSTHVSVSEERCFPNVDFIDTPGLVDGNVEYPFDVNKVLLFLADYADLIFVFLDPHEQALGSRTMEVVKMLNVDHYDKMYYYLTKIDTLNSLADLLKVSNQTTQVIII